MGTILEAASKKRRGRPQVFSRERTAIVASLFPELGSRQIRTQCYAVEAVGKLRDIAGGEADAFARWTWLLNDRGRIKTTILAELGKMLMAGVLSDAVLAELADSVCAERPNVKEHTTILRMVRRSVTAERRGRQWGEK